MNEGTSTPPWTILIARSEERGGAFAPSIDTGLDRRDGRARPAYIFVDRQGPQAPLTSRGLEGLVVAGGLARLGVLERGSGTAR